MINPFEVIETINMIDRENLDIRTITMGISLKSCAHPDVDVVCKKVYDKITSYAKDLVKVGEDIEKQYGIPIVNKRISVTPAATLIDALDKPDIDKAVKIAKALDSAAKACGVNFIGGYSALVHKGYTNGERILIQSIPYALSQTDIVCSSVNIGSTRAGINMDAVKEMGLIIKKAAELTKDTQGFACAKLVVFCNAVEDNPFMAGAFLGEGEGECVINVGVSGPGVVKCALEKVKGADFGVVAETIKKTAFKITRMGQLVAQEASRRLEVPFGIVDLSLAPTPAVGDSVAYILEEMGLEKCGMHGTTAALALLNDAVKKGGVMASGYVGGLSGAFIPVSEDAGMIAAAKSGALSIEKLEAMTCVCSVGLDMIVIPGDTPASVISAIIADEAAIGMVNTKTTAVRIIPAPGAKEGDVVEFGGLLGTGPVMPVRKYGCDEFIDRGGRIPAPLQSLKN
ncbi:MAG: PFL family protein [Clostridia bacterium]|nr:PFL family protein [Clostridia bacterium]